MSTVAVASDCVCGSIGRTDLRLCKVDHRYWRGDKELTSVSRVLRSTWPIAPDFSKADPAVLDRARDRGILVDHLFSAYVTGGRLYIPAGTRNDDEFLDESKALFSKLCKWWDRQMMTTATPQVMLADDEIAGTCDLLTADGWVYDLKCTYNIEPTYPLQLGAYAELHQAQFGTVPNIGIIHVSKRFPEPKVITLNVVECLADWRAVRSMWRVVQRRASK